MPGFLLDENLPKWWRKTIHSREPDLEIWRISDPYAPTPAALDPEILEWCDDNDFFLVTNNRKSMPKHLANHVAAGRHVPGIFVVDPGIHIDVVVADLALIAGAGMPEEFQDQIRYLPLT